VDDRGSIRVAQIRSKVRTVQRREPVGLVVVDYLQLMKLGHRVESRQQEVSEMSRALKLMAKELNVPVLALSQLNRGAAAGPERMPQMSDLRESGSLEQDADVVLLLHRDPERPDSLDLLVAKNRHGPNDRVVRLNWEGQFARATDQLNPTYGGN
jgi:replicative DNA helicase